MPTNRADILAAIVARLQTVAELKGRIYDHQVGEITGYPTTIVSPSQFDDTIADTSRNMRVYSFDIIVLIERGKDGFGTDKADRLRREIEDAVTAAFDSYQDLGGACLWLRMQSGGWDYSPEQTLAFFTIKLNAYQQVTISTT